MTCPAAPLRSVASRAAISQLSTAQRPSNLNVSLQPVPRTRLAVQRAEEKPLRLQAKASTALKTWVIRDTPSAWPAAELLLATVFPAPSARGQQDVHMSPRASVRPEAEVAVVVCADVVWGPGPHRPAPSTLLGLRALGPPVFPAPGRSAPSEDAWNQLQSQQTSSLLRASQMTDPVCDTVSTLFH